MLKFVKEEIGQLLKNNILVHSSSPYASLIHIAPENEPGKFRMVGDYRALNCITQPITTPCHFYMILGMFYMAALSSVNLIA